MMKEKLGLQILEAKGLVCVVMKVMAGAPKMLRKGRHWIVKRH